MGDEDTENTIRRDVRRRPESVDDESIADTIISARPAESPSPRAEQSASSDPGAPDPIARYRVSVNGGAAITLDTHVLIGRRPREPRVIDGARPMLVTVDSPKNEVSGTHIDVHQHGTSVIVTDVRSTNGTIVVMPGQAPVRLRPGDSLVAVPGTVVDIGDGNSVEILPLPRIHFADSGSFERLSP